MRVEESNGKTILLLDDQNDLNTLYTAFNSPDKETAEQHKARLGKLLDPLLRGRKIDEIQHVFADYGTGEILDYYAKNTFNRPIKFKNYERTLIDLMSYLSDAKREQLMSKNKVMREFLRGDFGRVMEHLENTASQFRTRGRNAELKYGIQTEAEKRGLVEPTHYEGERLPPPEYRKFLPKYGSSHITRSRPVRRTRKSKVTLRTVRLKVRVSRRK